MALYGVAMYNFCTDNVQSAIYLILSAIYMNLQLSKHNK
jgi:hypothetical protein